jgi:hypothetical protein
MTDSNSDYSFAGLETGGFYTVTPARANFVFIPRNLSFSLVANKTDASFIAIPEAVPTANPLDTPPEFFVRQQYLDFLGREPDQGGLSYWSAELRRCNDDTQCVNQRRIGVSAAFFVEGEFQQTGSFVYRLYKGALGRQITYAEFSADRGRVVGGDDLEHRKSVFADTFVRRPEFVQKYSSALAADSFVDALIQTMKQSSGVDLSSQRSTLIAEYNSGGDMNESRSIVVRGAVEDASFKLAEYNSAFVLMQYFGYLKRDPDQGGYDFWSNVLNNREPGNYRGMVCSFITSAEYQLRFAPVISHSNRECGQ